MHLDRRGFLGAMWTPVGAAALAAVAPPATAANLAPITGGPDDPREAATDEDFWSRVGDAFAVDRTVLNLNNGGVSPSPVVVQDAMRRHLELSNTAPPWSMWRVLEPRREAVRGMLAEEFGCGAEEIAITRNASESLQILQCGLPLERGDEILTTDQDYPRMLNTFRQLEARRGVGVRTIPVPTPLADPGELVRRFEEAITDRTRMILVCQVINLTGQILPVREVCRLGRARGIPVLVDGAHGFAHDLARRDDLDCDFYATSLHKWLFAPHGTGLLYVRRERIGEVWPLQAAAPEQRDDIRKFEEIGTHPAAPYLAIAEAVDFHRALGPRRKAARLAWLRDRWADRLDAHDRVRIRTERRPFEPHGIATFDVDGIDPTELSDHLWREHRILTTAIVHDDVRGVRVSPSVFTRPHEIDRFCDRVERVLSDGLS